METENSKYPETFIMTLAPIDPKSQNGQILSHLENGKTLTALEALKAFDCMRLPARISELRQFGYAVQTEMINVNSKRIARYSLV